MKDCVTASVVGFGPAGGGDGTRGGGGDGECVSDSAEVRIGLLGAGCARIGDGIWGADDDENIDPGVEVVLNCLGN
jgi:hypothetical protein